MTEHEEYLALISARLDGVLSPEEARRLEEHLAVCPDCQQAEKELRAIHEALCALPRLEPPDGFQERVMAAVTADGTANRGKKRLVWTKWLATAAMLAVIVGGTFALHSRQGAAGGQSNANGERSLSGMDAGKDFFRAEFPPTAAVSEDSAAPEAAPAEGAAEQPSVSIEGMSEDQVPLGTEFKGEPNSSGAGFPSTAAMSEDPAALEVAPKGAAGQSSLSTGGTSDTAAARRSDNPGKAGYDEADNGVSGDDVPMKHENQAEFSLALASLSPREALERLVDQFNAEAAAPIRNAYDSDTVSCVNSLQETGDVVNTVTYEGLSEDGAFYLFQVVPSGEETGSHYKVSLDGYEIQKVFA